jgi:hypothetical protein
MLSATHHLHPHVYIVDGSILEILASPNTCTMPFIPVQASDDGRTSSPLLRRHRDPSKGQPTVRFKRVEVKVGKADRDSKNHWRG